jgi:hypothetical protein
MHLNRAVRLSDNTKHPPEPHLVETERVVHVALEFVRAVLIR